MRGPLAIRYHDSHVRFTIPETPMNPGLCSTCAHARVVPHPRGGDSYWRCGRADTDAGFRKYPPLPVVQCSGHTPGTPETREPKA